MRDIMIVLAASTATLVLRATAHLESSPYIFGILGLIAAGYLFRRIKTYRV